MIDPAGNGAIVGRRGDRPAPAPRRWRRRAGVVAVAAAVLGLHVGVLQGWPTLPRDDRAAAAVAPLSPTVALEVRAVAAAAWPAAPSVVATAAVETVVSGTAAAAVPVAAVAAPPPTADRLASPVPVTAHASADTRPGAPTPVDAMPSRVPASGAVPDVAGMPRDADADAAAWPSPGTEERLGNVAPVVVAQASGGGAAAPKPSAGATAAPPSDVPVYATRLPPPVRWAYRLRRGMVSGTAVLDWQRRDGGGYRLSLEGSVAGVPLFEWVSTGRVDAHGVAPDRLVMRQVGSAARAANFQREAGVITYSARDVEHPLWPGAQDRLSWLVQASGIVAAAPEKFSVPGAQIAYQVTGVRGDVAVWRLDAMGPKTIEVAGGRVQAVLLRREPLKPFDTRGELWLDPQRHHLPVRLTLSTIGRAGEVVDSLTLELESTTVR